LISRLVINSLSKAEVSNKKPRQESKLVSLVHTGLMFLLGTGLVRRVSQSWELCAKDEREQQGGQLSEQEVNLHDKKGETLATT